MLDTFLSLDRIQRKDSVANWRETIDLVAAPLLTTGAIRPSYIQAIFDNYESTGPYFVIAPGIAMPHSRPEDGADENALSLLVLEEGVDFGSDNDPVRIIVMLSAKDSHSHMEMLSSLAGFLGEDSAVEQVLTAESNEAILQIIQDF